MTGAATYADMRGTIVSFTIINVPTPEFSELAPYGLAVIETSDGERILARMVERTAKELSIGATVVYDSADDHGPFFRTQ